MAIERPDGRAGRRMATTIQKTTAARTNRLVSNDETDQPAAKDSFANTAARSESNPGDDAEHHAGPGKRRSCRGTPLPNWRVELWLPASQDHARTR